MEQLLEKSELKTRLCHRLVIKMKFKSQSSLQTTQYVSLLNKVFAFSVILLYLKKPFCKHEIFWQYIVANIEV